MSFLKYCSNCVHCVIRLDKNNRMRRYCSILKKRTKGGGVEELSVSFDGTCYRFEESKK